MKRALFPLLCCASICLGQESAMRDAKSQGKKLAKERSKEALHHLEGFSAKDFDSSPAAFDADKARQQALSGELVVSDVQEFVSSQEMVTNMRENMGFDGEEYFFKRGELAAKNSTDISPEASADKATEKSYVFKTCRQSGDPYPLTINRSLKMRVDHHPAEKKLIKICLGHETTKTFRPKDINQHKEDLYDLTKAKTIAEKEKREADERLSKDTSIKKYSTSITTKYSRRHQDDIYSAYYKLTMQWHHIDNDIACDHSQNEECLLSEENWEEIEEGWQYDDKASFSRSQEPHCTLVDQQCIDSQSSKVINGKSISKPCWKERLSFLCKHPEEKGCLFLKAENCEFVSQTCLQKTHYGCALWEKTFKCLSSTHESLLAVEGINNEEEQGYTANQSFAAAITRLSVFNEMKHELEHTQAFDATRVRFFPGHALTCSKNVLENALYDCCFSHSGLAVKAKLAHCTADELSLAKKREQGLCHYVGKYDEKLAGALWKSRTVHSFCCFSSKLARVFQEQAHALSKKSWGKPKSPKCQGMKAQEIASLDFSKLDLREAFEGKGVDNLDAKMKSFQTRLEDIQHRMESR